MRMSPLPRTLAEPGNAGPCRTWVCAVLILLAFLFLAGCTDTSKPTGEEPQPPAVLVDYQRTGGIAGFSDHVVVFSDGQVVYSTRTSTGAYILSPGDVEILRGLIRDANFPALADNYPAPAPGADYFTYSIMVGNRVVTTETTGIPDELLPLITNLDEMIKGR